MDRISIWEDKNVLETDGGDGCTTLAIHLMPINCTAKNDEDGNLMFYVFPQNLNKKNILRMERYQDKDMNRSQEFFFGL